MHVERIQVFMRLSLARGMLSNLPSEKNKNISETQTASWIWIFLSLQASFGIRDGDYWKSPSATVCAAQCKCCQSRRRAHEGARVRHVSMSSRYRITTCVRRVLRVLAAGFAQKQKRVLIWRYPILRCVNFHVVTAIDQRLPVRKTSKIVSFQSQRYWRTRKMTVILIAWNAAKLFNEKEKLNIMMNRWISNTSPVNKKNLRCFSVSLSWILF